MSSETPKSEMIITSIPAAIASNAAVEETVTNALAEPSASLMAPSTNRTAPALTRPRVRRSSHSSGYGQASKCVCCCPGRARSLTTAEP